MNVEEFMRDKFLFDLNKSFNRFREDIFFNAMANENRIPLPP